MRIPTRDGLSWALALVLAAAGVAQDAPPEPEAAPDFNRDVRPLLSDRCFACHSGDEAKALRLDRREDAVDDLGGAAIVPGDAAGSALWRRVTHSDPARRMPPPESKLALSPAEQDVLRRWIEAGAPYEAHWAFTRPERAPEPEVRAAGWVTDPLDRHVLADIEAAGLAPAPEADPATLLRRLHLDLTGLPPTPEDRAAFLADPSPDAYERAVDALLASPAHAEHLAAQWLDVARYADTFGYQSDVDMHVWPWRDWLVRAFGENLPFDTFVRWQLAGDLVPDAPADARLATTFNRLHRQTNEGGSTEEEFRVQYVCDRVETMGAAFLGVTLNCAKCHDHKFDPIRQRDYYALFALFDGIDESGLYSHFTDAVPTPALDMPTTEQVAQLESAEAAVREAELALASARAASTVPPVWNTNHRFDCEAADAPVPALHDEPERVVGARGEGHGYRLSGENALTFPEVGVFERSDPFSIGLWLRAPKAYERAVVLHRSMAWTDSGSRGYQLMVEDGHLCVALIHFWPGDAIAIRSKAPLTVGAWQHVLFTYDGSSRAAGLRLYVDGERAETEVVRDHLTRTIQGGGIDRLTIGSRFRDKGFAGGEVDEIVVYDRELDDAQRGPKSVATLGLAAAGTPDPAVETALEALRAARRERDRLRDGVRQIMAMREAPEELQRTAYVLHRGAYDARRDPVEPGVPAALPALLDHPVRTRLDLAEWLLHPDHPLTARLHVDRLWRLVFGAGLLPAPEDLGQQSPPPVQRAVLDLLARDFVDGAASNGAWDTRALLRRLVCSATYRQSSVASPEALELDPNNTLLSRAPSHRLPAEVLRDGALFAAGLLAERRGGPPVMPYQPPGLWEEKSGKVYTPGRGDDLRRRSLYTFWRRTSPPPTLTMFDAPSREVCTVERERTESPLQTLALWNDPQFVEAAVHLGRRAALAATAQGLADEAHDAARVEHLFLALASRPPSEVERAAALGLLAAQRAAYDTDRGAATALASYDLERVAHPGDGAPGPSTLTEAAAVELATTAVLASALLSLDDVVTRR